MKKINGFTLIELLTVLAIISLLCAFALPGIKAMQESLSHIGPNKITINTLLQSARTVAIKNNSYGALWIEPNEIGQKAVILVSDPSLGYPDVVIDPEQKFIPFRQAEGFKTLQFSSSKFILDKQITQTYTVTEGDKRLFFVFTHQGQLVRKWVYLSSLNTAYLSANEFTFCNLRDLAAIPDTVAFIDALPVYVINPYMGIIIE